MRTAFIDALLDEARQDPSIMLLTGDLGFNVLEEFAEELPAQFLNCGVAEQSMIGVAAGLAASGRQVFVYSIANFPTFRCLEQIRNDVDIPTIAVGNITSWDQVNTILAAGRADLVALARPHLTDPHFSLRASAFYGVAEQRWPLPYDSGKEQSFRLATRERAESVELQKAAKPTGHRQRKPPS